MEQISSTFPFQDGLLHFSPIISARQQTKPPVSDHNTNPLLVFDLLKGDVAYDVAPTMKPNVILQQQHQQLQLQQKNPNNNPPHQQRKIIRRDVERQRRKEMGSLYKSLVGLIPYEYIKGKRSTSDRLQETVRYVKDLRKRVEKLSAKRDELKGVTEPPADSSSNSLLRPAAVASSSSLIKGRDECNDEQSRVTVKPCRAGVEVTVNVAAQKIKGGGGVSLSKILKVLVGDGLSINNCCSIKVNDRLLQTIEAEVIGGGSIDPTQLERKLSVLY
ncbi:PREDICTED: transcription factor bHLH36-like [Ipomoea nil]|uniref:transcription factor bHLH36-like n=1 Tax=Ipomoea nil TaxID=35883 RepID=UPI000901C590|nr:PREDICTED: transcription factor bHLH36-like [Ipomoea nil]